MIIQLSSNEQLIGGESFVQLRRGELCPVFNVSVCPKVVEMAMPKDGKLPIRFCQPNERHWGRWRQEALQLNGDLVNTCDNERDLFQVICELAEQEPDAAAI